MSLSDIIDKQQTIYTPQAQEVADSPEEQEQKFKFHVNTYVTMADVKHRWEAILNNLLKRRSSTGLIYADTGYGKTSTGASLWNYAEENGMVAVPPFIWNSLEDLLVATHGWVCYRLKHTRPDLIPNLEQKQQAIAQVDEETLIQRLVKEDGLSYDEAGKAIASLKSEGRFLNVLSPNQLLDYLRFATEQVLDAGYKGLMILPDEFQLFRNNPNTDQNYDRLKQFIFGIHGEEALPIGCVVLTYRETFANIRESEYNYILARFAKPTGSLIDLQNLYGEPGFPKNLWNKLSDLCCLSPSEKSAIDSDVLQALEQFLRHSRARSLMSGPRSVIETFRAAALCYTQKNRSYSIFDLAEDYLAGKVTFSEQHTETARAHTRVMALPIVNTPDRQKIVKLLSVYPEGVPPELFQKYGISDNDRAVVIEPLVGQHIITKGTGYQTLACYKDDLLAVDSLIEILRRLQERFNPENTTDRQSAVRAFHKHVFLNILTERKQGQLLGWLGMQEPDISVDGNYVMNLIGSPPNLREYPDRRLKVDISTEEKKSSQSTADRSVSDMDEYSLQVHFTLDTTTTVINTCHVTPNGLNFCFDICKPISPQKVPKDIGKLGELFLPDKITPLLLLSILDFFDRESTIATVKGARQEAQVASLTDRIRNELIRYFFSPQLKENILEGSTDFASVPAGKDFVETLLKILIPKRFPAYHAVAGYRGWNNDLGKYQDAISKGYPLGVRKGVDPIRGGARLFNIGQVAFDNLCNGVARNLLRIEKIPGVRDEQLLFFTTHPLEETWIAQLQNSSTTIVVDTKNTSAVKISTIYEQSKRQGYLSQEIDELLKVIKARGIANIHQVEGTEYLHLVETFIDFSDLVTKLEEIENSVTLAKSEGFSYQCDSLDSARMLTASLGIENDEVKKDELRQKLNQAEAYLKNKCAEWLKTEYDNLRQKINILQTLHLQIPSLLEQQTGHPLTEFSRVLFQSVQPEIKSAYTKISDEIEKSQAKVQETCDREMQKYETNKIPHIAIETAAQIQKACHRFDNKIEKLNQRRADAQELHRLFEYWRILASQMENNKSLMNKNLEDSVVKELIERLEAVERDIKEQLANNHLDLKFVMGNHEHFKTQFEAINAEFRQFMNGKEDKFAEYQSEIEKKLRPLLRTPLSLVDFNHIESEGSYRKVRENTVSALKTLIDEVLSENKNRQRELLKPIEVFKVSEALKTKAIQLREKLKKLAEEFQGVRLEFKVEAVDEKLSEWIENLNEKLAAGKTISERRRQLERELDEFVPEPSPRAQRLRDELTSQKDTDFTELIVRLLGDETFSSAAEILENLEELYQANLINLTVHRK